MINRCQIRGMGWIFDLSFWIFAFYSMPNHMGIIFFVRKRWKKDNLSSSISLVLNIFIREKEVGGSWNLGLYLSYSMFICIIVSYLTNQSFLFDLIVGGFCLLCSDSCAFACRRLGAREIEASEIL